MTGETLNARHVETLEEIFRRVQFSTIDMEATHLDDEVGIVASHVLEQLCIAK